MQTFPAPAFATQASGGPGTAPLVRAATAGHVGATMEANERRAVLILADISGYTKFTVANQLTAVHGQQIITFLIETILHEVDIPLVLHGIEGDAVFLSASHPGDDEGWLEVLALVRTKLPRFFDVFLEGLVRTAESTPCSCASCQNVDELKLKIIVHSGRAVYHTIAGLPQIAGTDVILAHRLLKNSVPSKEYLLMTEAAYTDLGSGMEGEFLPGDEDCEGIGRVKTMVRLMGPSRDAAREAFYAKPDAELMAEGERYVNWAKGSQMRALRDHLLRPSRQVGLAKRAAFTIRQLLTMPFQLRTMRAIPGRLVEQRRNRLAR